MKIVEADGFEFQFTDALDAFVFDEVDRTKFTFHGMLMMKAVDIIAEFENAYVYIELKDFTNIAKYDILGNANSGAKKIRNKNFYTLQEYLTYKFRDSYLYRHAEQKVQKPIHYICLLPFGHALNSRMQKELKLRLPVGKPECHPHHTDCPHRWTQKLAESCQVVNITSWNRNFPKWPVKRLSVQPQEDAQT